MFRVNQAKCRLGQRPGLWRTKYRYLDGGEQKYGEEVELHFGDWGGQQKAG